MEREQHAVLIIFVPSEAPSAVVIVPHDGEEEGKPGFSTATRGAAPGPRCRRSGECPGATRATFYAPVVGGNAPERASAVDFRLKKLITSIFGESCEHFAGVEDKYNICMGPYVTPDVCKYPRGRGLPHGYPHG